MCFFIVSGWFLWCFLFGSEVCQPHSSKFSVPDSSSFTHGKLNMGCCSTDYPYVPSSCVDAQVDVDSLHFAAGWMESFLCVWAKLPNGGFSQWKEVHLFFFGLLADFLSKCKEPKVGEILWTTKDAIEFYFGTVKTLRRGHSSGSCTIGNSIAASQMLHLRQSQGMNKAWPQSVYTFF